MQKQEPPATIKTEESAPGGDSMVVLTVSPEVYQDTVQRPFTVFHSAIFNVLNAAKCEQVLYLLFQKKKYRLGLIGGIREQRFYSPFSAPFGGFSDIKQNTRIKYLDEALFALEIFLKDRNIYSIHLTLPPFRYDSSFISKINNALLRQQYELVSSDLNHHFELNLLQDNYINKIKHSARKHILKAQKLDFTFSKAETTSEKKQAYDIIQHNRKVRGNPLHLTWEMLQQTIALVQADFFLLRASSGYVAAAICFYVLPQVVQIVYWGSLPEKNDLRPMNLLALNLFEFYKQQGLEWLDIGQSSICGVPQQGLCDFKESMGCTLTLKLSFSKNIS